MTFLGNIYFLGKFILLIPRKKEQLHDSSDGLWNYVVALECVQLYNDNLDGILLCQQNHKRQVRQQKGGKWYFWQNPLDVLNKHFSIDLSPSLFPQNPNQPTIKKITRRTSMTINLSLVQNTRTDAFELNWIEQGKQEFN